ELVARWIMEEVKWKKPFKRLWISSQTDQAIREGFSRLKPGEQFNALYQSAVCRAEADWLIGLNITRALTVKYNAQLSAGRVQTPTLSMLIERENAIKQFIPQPYNTVSIRLSGFQAVWRDPKSGSSRIFVSDKADALRSKVEGRPGKITQLKTEQKSTAQPLPYDLTELQRDANRKFGFSAKHTLSVLQKLYEQHKLVTYPRTDSRYLTSDMVGTFAGRLNNMSVSPYAALIKPIIRQNPLLQAKHAVNDSKVTDHHAIIPTEQSLMLSKLSADERKLYDLIALRFIALFYPLHRYAETSLVFEVNGEPFHASGKTVKEPGWQAVYTHSAQTDEDSDEEDADEAGSGQALPQLAQGYTETVKRVDVRQGMTKPPAHLTEASLLSAMEKYNLGTPATRADIIEKLVATDTIERQSKQLLPTGKGWQLIELVAEELRSPELTAKWELELEQIARGKGNMKQFLATIRSQTTELVQEIKTSAAQYKPHNLTHKHCPECGKPLMEVKGKRGKILVCSNQECEYRRSDEQTLLNKRCPQCHRKMELRSGKSGKFAQCRKCNVVESLEESGGKPDKRKSKQLVQQFSDNQSFGTSLGDLLNKALEKNEEHK
ncbi:MAG: DNA topoisomerase III, partial [Paenibacillus sp. RIFOXYA1_FULL_44_5]